ncbi:hypothetical protein ACP4OV_004995 [Aristida adscensionis]
MGGSRSPAAAAAAAADVAVGADRGPCERQRANAEDTYQHEQPVYFPEELVGKWSSFSRLGLYHCYKISLRGGFNATTAPSEIILAVKCDMGPDFLCYSFNLGDVQVTMEYNGIVHLNQEQFEVS